MIRPSLLAACACVWLGCTDARRPPSPDDAAGRWTPPHGTIDVAPEPGEALLISPDALSVGAVAVLPLARRRLPPAGVVRHVSPALRDALTGLAGPAAGRLHLMADRDTPFLTLIDAVFTATRSGFTDFDLVVHDGTTLRAQPFATPKHWRPPDDSVCAGARDLELRLVVRADGVDADAGGEQVARFPRPSTCDAGGVCQDLAGIAALAARLKRLAPNEVVVTLQVDGEVDVQTVVAVLDAVRGEGCRLAPALAGGAIPEACLFWQPILDLDPMLHHGVDRVGVFTVGDAAVVPAGEDPREAQLLADYAAARPRIARCLSEAMPDLADADTLTVVYATSPADPRRTTARVRKLRDPALGRCIVDALGAAPHEGSAAEHAATSWAELSFSTRFEPAAPPHGPR
jgi:biopolymer transport protein ExbD